MPEILPLLILHLKGNCKLNGITIIFPNKLLAKLRNLSQFRFYYNLKVKTESKLKMIRI